MESGIAGLMISRSRASQGSPTKDEHTWDPVISDVSDRGERIATWEGGKGVLLEEIFGNRDAIVDSDQGKTFPAFWDFLMSPARQEEANLPVVCAGKSLVEHQIGVTSPKIEIRTPGGRHHPSNSRTNFCVPDTAKRPD